MHIPFSNQRERRTTVRGNKGPAEARVALYLAAQCMELQGAELGYKKGDTEVQGVVPLTRDRSAGAPDRGQ